MIQDGGQLVVGDAIESIEDPPEDWRPPFVDPELWEQAYHPELGLSDAEWLVVWAYFGPGRGRIALTATWLQFEGEDVARRTAVKRVTDVLDRPHVQQACEYVRGILSHTVLSADELRSWWSEVVRNDRVELNHRLTASSNLAKSLGVFVDRRQISHEISVDLSQLTNEQLAEIAAGGGARQGTIVDATLVSGDCDSGEGDGDVRARSREPFTSPRALRAGEGEPSA